MPRRRASEQRKLDPDPKYNNILVTKFINMVMKDGKRAIAEKIVYGALERLEKGKESAIDTFLRALEHASPLVEVKSRRVGGATYQVPIEVSTKRRVTLAMRWIIDAARKRGQKDMAEKLANELEEAADESSSTGGSRGKGNAVKKREDTHRMAEANKAFAHYRW